MLAVYLLSLILALTPLQSAGMLYLIVTIASAAAVRSLYQRLDVE